ncbi:hypothetical protein RCL1_001987 [Eukaryota sp. TZLM3-RCL]
MLVQYVIINQAAVSSYPLGAVVTQGVHAAVNVVHRNHNTLDVLEFISQPLGVQHSITLAAKDSDQLLGIKQKLDDAGIDSVLWVEQPENTPTALAIIPCDKERVKPIVKRLRLLG